MAYPKYAQIKGGHSQAKEIYKCPKCQELGQGNKMIHHMKHCNGSGFRNYYSKRNSKMLKILLANLF